MLFTMFEDYSRNSRFLKWLETVAGGASQAYPQRETLSDDAAAFLARWDRTRKENRGLEERYRELATGVAALAETSPNSPPEALLDALAARFESKGEAAADTTAKMDADLDASRAELARAQDELELAREQLTATQADLERERRRLEPVLRYAFNLRRVVQKIHSIGRLTPQLRGYIEQLLEAGGVSVQGGEKPPPQASAPPHSSAAGRQEL